MKEYNLGEVIHHRRKELGITLEQIGNACGVNRSTVMRWETGRAKDIKRSHLSILSQLLYLPLDVLLGVEDENTVVEDANVVLKRKEIINLLNTIKDENKLDNIKKYIEVFGK